MLAYELLEDANNETIIAIVSAPSVYAAIKKRQDLKISLDQIYLFEFDKRFQLTAGDKFVFYDYNKPLIFPKELKGRCNRLLIDPPFLSDECQTKGM